MTIFMVQHLFCYGSHSQSLHPVGEKRQISYDDSHTVHFIMSSACQACQGSYMTKCLSDFYIRLQHSH